MSKNLMLKEGWSHVQSELIISTSQTKIYVKSSLKDFTIFYLELLLIACASSSTRYCHLMRWKYRTSWTTWFPKKIYYSLSCKYLTLLGMVVQQSGCRFFFLLLHFFAEINVLAFWYCLLSLFKVFSWTWLVHQIYMI